MFSVPSMEGWVNAFLVMGLTVGIMIGMSILVALGVIKMLGKGEEPQAEKGKDTTPKISKKTRTAA